MAVEVLQHAAGSIISARLVWITARIMAMTMAALAPWPETSMTTSANRFASIWMTS